jgi:hypothetical protein
VGRGDAVDQVGPARCIERQLRDGLLLSDLRLLSAIAMFSAAASNADLGEAVWGEGSASWHRSLPAERLDPLSRTLRPTCTAPRAPRLAVAPAGAALRAAGFAVVVRLVVLQVFAPYRVGDAGLSRSFVLAALRALHLDRPPSPRSVAPDPPHQAAGSPGRYRCRSRRR